MTDDASGSPPNVHQQLVDLALLAPGPAAPRGALTVLRAMATRGDVAAAVALGGVVATELGLDASGLVVGPETSFARLGDISGPPLAPLLAASCFPRQLLADVDHWTSQLAVFWDEDVFARFQDVVRRRGATEDEAVRAYAVGSALQAIAARRRIGMPAGRRFSLHLLDLASQARVVPGDNANAAMQFGRDLILAQGRVGSFQFRLGHEFGHSMMDGAMAGVDHDGPADRSGAYRALAAELPTVLAAVAAGTFAPTTLPSGLHLMASVDPVHGAALVHLSVTDRRGPTDVDGGAAVALVAAQLLDVDPARVGLAHSGGDVLHVGIPVAALDPDRIADRAPSAPGFDAVRPGAAAWLDSAVSTGRIGVYEQALPRLAGLAAERTILPTAPDARRDLARHEDLMDDAHLTGQTEKVRRELLAVAVRCGNPAAVERVLMAGPMAEPGDAGLSQLGGSFAVMLDGAADTFFGPMPVGLLLVIGQLASAGIDVSRPVFPDGRCLLSDAAARSTALTVALLDSGVSIASRDASGATALAEARTGATATALLDAGADVAACDAEGATALHRAAERDAADLVAHLLSRGAPASTRDVRGGTPLLRARSAPVVELLCAAGAGVDEATTAGMTPLMAAALRGDEACVRALLSHDADVGRATAQGAGALHHGAQAPASAARAVIGALVAAGADVDAETDSGDTPIGLAAVVAHPEAVAALLAAGADPRAANVHGITALMCASHLDLDLARNPAHVDDMMACSRLLLDAGADMAAVDDDGRTALHFATRGFHSGPVELLLERGADPNVVDAAGHSPLDNARAQDHGHMVALLLAAGAVDSGAGDA